LSNGVLGVNGPPMSVIAYQSEIVSAAERHGLNPRLLAAVAAQETGGPGSDSGRNVVGDAGHGHGVFQIDDRYHAFARTRAAMDPAANADYAAGMLVSLLRRYGDVRRALSAYNAGDPDATGTVTTWGDGRRLGYADSVLRHYARLPSIAPPAFKGTARMGFSLGNLVKGIVRGVEALALTANPIAAAGIGALTALGSGRSAAPMPTFDPLLDEMSANLNAGSSTNTYSYRQVAGLDASGRSTRGQQADFGSLIDGGDGSDDDPPGL